MFGSFLPSALGWFGSHQSLLGCRSRHCHGINQFGVVKEKNMYGKKVMGIARTTFVIGPDGKIKHIFNNVKPEGHAEQVLDYLREQQKTA
jgi:peroxiredoxin